MMMMMMMMHVNRGVHVHQSNNRIKDFVGVLAAPNFITTHSFPRDAMDLPITALAAAASLPLRLHSID